MFTDTNENMDAILSWSFIFGYFNVIVPVKKECLPD